VETDYLVVGAGASGLAFADTLVAEADVDVTLIDRRTAPGGHWLDAYSFVRLHTAPMSARATRCWGLARPPLTHACGC
jgi:ribulose 1,5-bisphosphate synthetase/thiazole synthase